MPTYQVKINGADAAPVTAETDNAAVDSVRASLSEGAHDIEIHDGAREVSSFSCFVEPVR